jgi:hypothetical protein
MKALVWKKWSLYTGSSTEHTEQTIGDSLQGVVSRLADGREITVPHHNIALAQYHEICGMA